jgi:phosphotransferase system enzyme I (PtsP)
MLETLRSIVQEVNTAKDLNSALVTVVERVQLALDTNACAIFLLDSEQKKFLLRADVGLNETSSSSANLTFSEGLVNLVGARAEPINIKNASDYPDYHYLPGGGADKFYSFLGVPIIHHRNVLGVLVAHGKESYKFDEEAEAFLITLASQLAVVLAHAEATGTIKEILPKNTRKLVKFEGVAGASGIAIGEVVVVYPLAEFSAVPDRGCADVGEEIRLFNEALSNVKNDIKEVSAKLSDELGLEERALFDVYIKILDDSALGSEIEAVIKQGQWAQGALREVILRHVQVFEKMEDLYLRERGSDIRNLGRRILSYLQKMQNLRTEFPEQIVLVGEELTPANLGEVPPKNLVGLVSIRGSKNSHISIMARAMEIPIVVGAVDVPYLQMDGMEVIVDGYQGLLFPSPSNALKQHFISVIAEEQAMVRGLEALGDLPSITLDHHKVPILVNTGLLSDVARSIQRGAEGVGLYRTEVPFMMSDRFPSEQQQAKLYRQHLAAFFPNRVTMRTLDVGGDKALPYFPINEDNPFLGWRGIRITLDHPEIFLVQIRAMLKASEGLNNLRIMLPMISNVTEVDEALQFIKQAYDEVIEEGHVVEMPPVGVMIEVPASVYQAQDLAKRVDFLSVGSNDLTQYMLAVDRNNSAVADLYHSFHPAVLQALCFVVQSAHRENKPVSICGELAGNPRGTLLLIAMGYDELSMSAASILKAKSLIRSVTMVQAKALLDEVLLLDTASAVKARIDEVISDIGLAEIDTSV